MQTFIPLSMGKVLLHTHRISCWVGTIVHVSKNATSIGTKLLFSFSFSFVVAILRSALWGDSQSVVTSCEELCSWCLEHSLLQASWSVFPDCHCGLAAWLWQKLHGSSTIWVFLLPEGNPISQVFHPINSLRLLWASSPSSWGRSIVSCCASSLHQTWDGILPYLRHVTLCHPGTPNSGQSLCDRHIWHFGLLGQSETASLWPANVGNLFARR